MSGLISMLRAAPRPTQPALSVKQTGLFTHQDSSTPFACPYCAKNFWTLSGQARHIGQTECRAKEAAKLATAALKRRLEESFESDAQATKRRVRFVEGDVTSIVRIIVEAQPIASETVSPTHAEPTIESAPLEPTPQPTPNPPDNNQPPPTTSRQHLVTPDGGHTYIESFPNPLAGSPINDYVAPPVDLHAYIYSTGCLSDPDHFDTLELLMTNGLTNKGRDRFLKSRLYRGNTPWRTCDEMLCDLDKLPHGPKWEMYEIEIKEKIAGVRVEYLFGRNIIEVIRSLIGNVAFKDQLCYAPERHWTSKARKGRVYSEAWTGNWWWRLQLALTIVNVQLLLPDKSATIIPLIIATDRTQLSTMCGGQQAYPVYVSIGNIPKSIRRKASKGATVLLGYLPVDEFEHVSDANERARLKHKLTHDAMAKLMEPLKEAAKNGVVMTCADGRQRRVYPVPAAFEGDWPEQCAMACADEGGCPVCEQDFAHRSDYPNQAPVRDPAATLAALRTYRQTKDVSYLEELRLKPWWPWWANIPYVNFHRSIMPDLLHQLYQGLIKTCAVKWSMKVFKPDWVDMCLRAMPETVGMRHFEKGISKIKKWTGRESKEMAQQLLPIVASHDEAKGDFVAAIRAILDFSFRAHQSRMTEEDIGRLEGALASFHAKKDILTTVGVYNSLTRLNRIRKLHMATHYGHSIREMGTPDGYSTEAPENLHIIYAKRGWRKSNKVRPFPQMVKFIQRYEAMRIHRAYINLYFGLPDRERMDGKVVYGEDEGALVVDDEEVVEEVQDAEDGDGGAEGDAGGINSDEEDSELVRVPAKGTVSAEQHVCLGPDWAMSIKPAVPQVPGTDVIDDCSASDFDYHINIWLQQAATAGLLHGTPQLVSRHHRFDIWHKFYLHHRPLYFDPDQPPRRDTIRAKPPAPVRPGSSRSPGYGKFDTVLFLAKPEEFGIHRYRAGRVRVIFTLPLHLRACFPYPLVYLELFTPFSKSVPDSHRMHSTSHDLSRGKRRALVIPLTWVVAACHLAPLFNQFEPGFHIERHDLLSVGRHFFLNHYANHFIFGLIDHWRAVRTKANKADAAQAKAAPRAKAARTGAIEAHATAVHD